ncbi:MAG: hypothetical protein OEZ22_11245 [Spirochaetia bacterium]|nr:hypothetical protein [Spirochaetia bacterium]
MINRVKNIYFCSLLSLSFVVFIFLSCGKTQIKKSLDVSSQVDEFKKLNWSYKIDFIQSIQQVSENKIEEKIFNIALEDSHTFVIKYTLKKIRELKLENFREKAYLLSSYYDPMVRWYALLYLESIKPEKEDLIYISKRFTDSEWLVREAAVRSVQKYELERKRKKYYYKLIFRLAEKNPLVLKQIYFTLRWYDPKKSLPYLIKRSYLARTKTEMILILEELSQFKSRSAQRRVLEVARNHKDGVVRFQALSLYQNM